MKFEKVWWWMMFLIDIVLFSVSIHALLEGVIFGLIGIIGAVAFAAMLYHSKHFLETNHTEEGKTE